MIGPLSHSSAYRKSDAPAEECQEIEELLLAAIDAAPERHRLGLLKHCFNVVVRQMMWEYNDGEG